MLFRPKLHTAMLAGIALEVRIRNSQCWEPSDCATSQSQGGDQMTADQNASRLSLTIT